MSYAKQLATTLRHSQTMFEKTLTTFSEEDSGFAPQDGLFTVAGHVAHVAGTVDWFVDGAFGDGWNMDFDGHLAEAKAVHSLADALEWSRRAYARAIEVVESSPEEVLRAKIEDTRIMAGQPRAAIIDGIADHTAHDRGALTVYARLLGKTPVMPYA